LIHRGIVIAELAETSAQKENYVPDQEGKSKLEISNGDRKMIAKDLAGLLADTYTLYLRTSNFHWNVTGPMFQTLHEMFEEQYKELAKAVDKIAERIRALGEPAPATFAEFIELASYKEVLGVPDAEQMIYLLIKGQEAIITTASDLLPKAIRANDSPTSDLLTKRIEQHQKIIWKLKSILA
jgi:starvation-inducible DNA-binding protein